MEFDFKGITWRVGHPWGNCHPKHLNSWFGEDTVRVTNDKIVLTVNDNPKEFFGDIHPYSCGLISSVDMFSYGVYEAEIKLPATPNAWASFWTCSYYGDWLHEVDICEAETNDRGDYNTELFKGKLFKSSDVTTNFHYKDSFLEHHQVGAKGISKLRFISGIDIEDFNKYKMTFDKNYIQIEVNDKCVRKLADKKVLKWFNNSPYFYFIINQDINLTFDKDDYMLKDEMVIKSVKKIK